MKNPAMYLHEICNYIEKVSVWLLLQYVAFCKEVDTSERKYKQWPLKDLLNTEVFSANISHLNADCFVWVDETGTDARSHIWKFGYSLKGITPTQ